MKMNLSSDELDSFDAMSDEDLTATIREALKAFRGKGGAAAEDDEEPPAETGGLSHAGRSTSTIETPASRRGNQSANDAAPKKLVPNIDRLDGITRL